MFSGILSGAASPNNYRGDVHRNSQAVLMSLVLVMWWQVSSNEPKCLRKTTNLLHSPVVG